MAKRPAWTVKNGKVVCSEFEFIWNGGFAIIQKQKNISNLHSAIAKEMQEAALEVSSKSFVQLGREIGAFSLKLDNIPLENVFQSSKKYELGGPYLDLLYALPKESKQDERHKNSGKLVSFIRENEEWPLEPRTLFYDYIYNKAMVQNYGVALDLTEYKWFTDIEFNPNKSINCQARSIAIYKLLQTKNLFDVLDSKEAWMEFHKLHILG